MQPGQGPAPMPAQGAPMPPQPGGQPPMAPQAGSAPHPGPGAGPGKIDPNNPLAALMVRRFEGLNEDEAETFAADMTPALAAILAKLLPEVARVFSEAVTYQGDERGMMQGQPAVPQPASGAPQPGQGQPMGQPAPQQGGGRLNAVTV